MYCIKRWKAWVFLSRKVCIKPVVINGGAIIKTISNLFFPEVWLHVFLGLQEPFIYFSIFRSAVLWMVSVHPIITLSQYLFQVLVPISPITISIIVIFMLDILRLSGKILVFDNCFSSFRFNSMCFIVYYACNITNGRLSLNCGVSRLEDVRAHQLSSATGYMCLTIKNVTNLARAGRVTCRVQAWF